MTQFKLSAPWVTYYRELQALFAYDPEVEVQYAAGDGEEPKIKLLVEGTDKADALAELLPDEVKFGNVTVYVSVVPSNKEDTKATLFRKAFEGNPALSYIASVEGVFTNPIHYVVFRNEVVQFFNDDINDINGNETTLYEDIARNVFGGDDGICFCTDLPDNLGIPVGA